MSQNTEAPCGHRRHPLLLEEEDGPSAEHLRMAGLGKVPSSEDVLPEEELFLERMSVLG